MERSQAARGQEDTLVDDVAVSSTRRLKLCGAEHIFSRRTDYVLVQDKSFKKFAKAYADNQELFFKEYVSVPVSEVSC